MKEYRSRNSGRYVFNEDMHNLQELALSPAELFRDCGLNFVISGCAITVTQNNGVYTISVTEGYVWLNGKIRKVAAFSGTTNNISTIGIYAVVSVGPLITYFNGDSDNQYNDYSGAVQINYDNTGGTDFIAAVYSGGNYAFPNLRTAYFDHYCIMNNGTPGHVGSLLADEIDTAVLKINHVPVADIYVPKAGCTMNNGASLVFVNGSDSTTISGSSLTVGGTITGEDLSLLGDATVEGDITAASFIKDGGTSSQFLKADGSVDETSYATASALADYLPLSGGTLTGNLKCNVNLAVDGNISVLGNIVVSTNLNVQGTISGVNETLTGNLNAADGTFTGDINAHDGTFTGELVADSAEITNGFTAGTITVNGAATIGGALTTQSTATIGGNTTISGELTASKIINSTSSDLFILLGGGGTKALSDLATAAALSQAAAAMSGYLPLTGGTLTGDVTCQTKVTASQFIKDGGTSSQFLKADGSVDSNTYMTGIAAESITTNMIEDEAVTAAKIKDYTITRFQIAPRTIEHNQIAPETITSYELDEGCVTESRIFAGAVTTSKIADGAVTAIKIADGTITSAKLAASVLSGYATSSSLSNYLLKSGGTITGNLSVTGTLSVPQISCNEQVYTTSLVAAGSNIGIATAYSLVADVVSSKSFVCNGSTGRSYGSLVIPLPSGNSFGTSLELTFEGGILVAAQYNGAS